MANQIPLKVRRTNGNTDALAEFESGDLISVAHGGTGAGDAAAARAALAVAAQADLAAHVGNTNNPHNVTATQVGAIAASDKGAALGVATLDAGGKVPAVQIPAVALPSVSVVADAAARAALTVQEGDEAIQTDDGSHWIYDGTSWIQRTTGAGGDVVGPAGTADNALARFDGATGKIIQSSVATVDDAGNLNFPGNITIGGTVDGREVAADGAALDAHAANTNNPHAVTAAQVGADPAGSAAAVQTALTTHATATNNPHAVTATQVGAIAASDKGAALGVATLDAGGKVPAVQIPAVALPSVSVVADAAARAALTVQEGDEAIQTDDGSHWIYDGTSWIQRTTGAGGDVVGPAGTADNALARFDGATGKIIQSSVATVDDAGNLNFPGNITIGGTVDGREVAADGAALDAHAANTNNPHAVTAAQVGADPAGSAAAVQTALTTHATATNNPHAVTATQVGAIAASDKGAALGVATLDAGGKVPAVQIPAVALPSVSVVADAAARAALTVQEGDEAIQTDDGSHWIYDGTSWIQRTTGAGGDVVGPAGTADNALARFDGATGKIIQSSVATVDDAGNLNFPGNITIGGTVDGREVAADGAALDAHAANTNNPHNVTATQVGAVPEGAYRAGRVFADAAARDSYAAWSGLIAVLLGDDSWWQYSGSAWATYPGVRPLYMIGTSTAAAVSGHLQNGVVYDEEG